MRRRSPAAAASPSAVPNSQAAAVAASARPASIDLALADPAPFGSAAANVPPVDAAAADLTLVDIVVTEPLAPETVAAAAVEPAPALRLPAILDLRAAGPLAAEFVALSGTAIDVDASPVQKLGGQCLQVLLSARACWEGDGLGFRIVDPSPGFLDGLALLGATASLSTASLSTQEG